MNPPPFKVVLSRCGKYRYLNKFWLSEESWVPVGTFILLNPSTASLTYQGPTAAKTLSAARANGFAQVFVVNLFAYCAPDPRQLRLADDPVGPDNETWIKAACHTAWDTGGKVVCAWGNGGQYRGMGKKILQWLEGQHMPVHALALTKDGSPQHPLRAPLGGQLLTLYMKGDSNAGDRISQGPSYAGHW